MADDTVRERSRVDEVIEQSLDLDWCAMDESEMLTAFNDIQGATIEVVLVELRAERARYSDTFYEPELKRMAIDDAIARIEKLRGAPPKGTTE